MYTIVLMTALTTSSATPDCHRSYGCCGYSCHGCCGYSSCYGCCGYSCYGGCYGGYSCYGGCYGGPVVIGSCYGGCTSCYGGYGMGYVPMTTIPMEKVKDKEEQASAKAKLVVEVPADAKLYIDDQLMKTTSERRTFNTPMLVKGQTYYYEVRAEVMREGRPVTETKKVIVRAGEEVKADFTGMGIVGVAKGR